MRACLRLVCFLLAASQMFCAGTGKAPGARVQGELEKAVATVLKDLDATFVLYDNTRGQYLRYNPERARTRFSPCSTFKIPNTLIALDSGVANDPDFAIAWDKEKYPKEPWWDEFLAPNGMHHDRDHTLHTAFRQSVVWFFRELAMAQGEERMQQYLDRFDYGNRDISSGLEGFWLTGSIAISAEEQVAFLKKLYFEQLGVSDTATAMAKEVFAIEKGRDYVLSAKTGSGGSETTPLIGWYVGYVEKGNDIYFFAFNMAGKNFGEILNKRVPLAKAALRALGVLE